MTPPPDLPAEGGRHVVDSSNRKSGGGVNLLIVKLGAMGDVLRTTPLLAAFKKQHPSSKITWVVDGASSPVLLHNPLIDRLWTYTPRVMDYVAEEDFDLALNLDKEPEALGTIGAAHAAKKMGFGWNAERKGIVALNPASEYAVRLGLDDELKFKTNRKTYQEISFEQAELPYAREEYAFHVPPEDLIEARRFLQKLGGDEPVRWIGLNTGSGDRFAGKRLSLEQLAELSKLLVERTGRKVLLLGGPKETERNIELERLAAPYALNAGTNHSIQAFAAIVSYCDVVISGDTIAMHVAIAMRRPTVVFFGSTSAPEIELYGRGRKIVSTIECAPCYKKICPIDEQCMKDMDIDRFMEETEQTLAVSGKQ